MISDTIESVKGESNDITDRIKNSFIPSSTLEDSVYLYLPPKLEYEYSANWQKVQLGALGAGNTIGGHLEQQQVLEQILYLIY